MSENGKVTAAVLGGLAAGVLLGWAISHARARAVQEQDTPQGVPTVDTPPVQTTNTLPAKCIDHDASCLTTWRVIDTYTLPLVSLTPPRRTTRYARTALAALVLASARFALGMTPWSRVVELARWVESLMIPVDLVATGVRVDLVAVPVDTAAVVHCRPARGPDWGARRRPILTGGCLT